jgi:hypothetical protein
VMIGERTSGLEMTWIRKTSDMERLQMGVSQPGLRIDQCQIKSAGLLTSGRSGRAARSGPKVFIVSPSMQATGTGN